MNENISSSAGVLHKTSNLAISRCSFADDRKELDKSENARAGRGKLLFLFTKYANLWSSCCRRRCRCLSSLISVITQTQWLVGVRRTNGSNIARDCGDN